MKTLTKKIGVIQNLGIADRSLRVIVGAFLLGGAVAHLQIGGGYVGWHAYAGLISIYPFLTGILGWDPVYKLFSVKTCRKTGRNQCGTFPYEVDALLGHRPRPDHEYDHSLSGSHH